jgi:hypothetical protein
MLLDEMMKSGEEDNDLSDYAAAIHFEKSIFFPYYDFRSE